METETTPTGRWMRSIWIMVAALVVAAMVISGCAGDDGAPAPATGETLPTPATRPSATTTPVTPVTSVPVVTPTTSTADDTTATTSPATSAPATAPTTLVPAAVVTAWEPDCVDRFGDRDDLPTADPGPDEFTTLGAAPSLEILLPTIDTINGTVPPLVSASIVPGGVLLVMHEYADVDGVSVPLTVVSIVDLDGGIRWRRCFEDEGWYGGTLVPSGDAAAVWIAFNGADGGDGHLRWFSPVSGLDVEAPIGLGDGMVVAVNGPNALIAKWFGGGTVGPDDEMGWFDADEALLGSMPYPDVAVGDTPGSVFYFLVDLGDEVVATATGLNDVTPGSIWVDGAWSDRPDDLRRLPRTLRMRSGADGEALQLLDGAGDVVWSVPGFHGIGREGFNSAVAGSVALVMECLSWTEETGCGWVGDAPPDEQLTAFDLDTGERLWARPGGQAFALLDGDRGIVTADLDGDGTDDGWELIDLRTGERADDVPVTTWAGTDIFRNACCGEGDYVFTRLDGGALLEFLEDRLRVWLSPEATEPTVTVDAFG